MKYSNSVETLGLRSQCLLNYAEKLEIMIMKMIRINVLNNSEICEKNVSWLIIQES